MNHLNGWNTAASEYVANASQCDTIAANQGCSHPVTLFRPPYGRITRKQIRRLAHYRVIMWDVLSQDYNSALSPDKCLRGTIDACRPGSIIVFHDSYKSQRNMEYTLPRLIDHFASKGYRFKPIQ
jgi:peptidoglycan/xylan/chitin deacetylase (PgdA/CDA1 family)